MQTMIAGVDEVGRGPLAGPVLAVAAIIIQPLPAGVRDSKKLTAKQREGLFEMLTNNCIWAAGWVEVAEIDALNIHYASLLAMQRALHALPKRPQHVLVDGKFLPQWDGNIRAIIGGDDSEPVISAASIIAKVLRDRHMAELHAQHPHYGWDRNAGYGTTLHRAGIAQHGLTPHHRHRFCQNLFAEAA